MTESNSNSTSPTTARVADNLHHAVDSAADSAGHAEQRLREQAEKTAGKAREMADRARVQAGQAVGTVSRYTRDNPLAALGIAFAAGAVVASLTRR